jgi:hypothetical protein
MGSRTRNSRKELMRLEKTLLMTSICRGIYTLVTRLAFPTMAPRAEPVPTLKNRQAIMATNRLAAKFCSCLKIYLKTKYRTADNSNGLRIDQKKPSKVF